MPDTLDPSEEADRILRDLDNILERLDTERKFARIVRNVDDEAPPAPPLKAAPAPEPVEEKTQPPVLGPGDAGSAGGAVAPPTPPSPFDPPVEEKTQPPVQRPKPEPPKPASVVQHSALPASADPDKTEPGSKLPPPPPPPPEPVAEPAATANPTPPPNAEVPAGRVRAVGFVFCAAAKPDSQKFLTFVDEVSRKSSRNPIAVTPAFLLDYDEPDPRIWLAKAKETEAKAMVVIVPGRGEKKDMIVALSEAKLVCKVLALDEIFRRASVVDLVVDLLLGH